MQSAADSRSITEILEAEDGSTVGSLWVSFCADEESDSCLADVQDIYMEEPYRGHGIAAELMTYAENEARENGAKGIRSGTGCENLRSVRLHNKLSYYQYRYEFKKFCTEGPDTSVFQKVLPHISDSRSYCLLHFPSNYDILFFVIKILSRVAEGLAP